MIDPIRSVQTQIDNIEENLLLIAERKTCYVLETDIPLDLVKTERQLSDKLQLLRQQLKNLSADKQGRELYGYLYRKQGEIYVERYELRLDEIKIGRHPDKCDLVLPMKLGLVSNVHAKIMRHEDGVLVEDMSSRNGTFVDGQRITEPTYLAPGQQLLLGGKHPHSKVCELEFSLSPIIPTEDRTHIKLVYETTGILQPRTNAID